MPRHQYGMWVLFPRRYFQGETVDDVTICGLFSHARRYVVLKTYYSVTIIKSHNLKQSNGR